jgi:hypothetical protein
LGNGSLARGQSLRRSSLPLGGGQRNRILARRNRLRRSLIRGDLGRSRLCRGLRGSRLRSDLRGACRRRRSRHGSLPCGGLRGAGLRGRLHCSCLRRHYLRSGGLGRSLLWRGGGLSRTDHSQGRRSEKRNHKDGLDCSSEHILDPLFRAFATSNRMFP